MSSVYIIFSEKLGKYYVGETIDVRLRLNQHNTGYFDKSFTSSVTDWSLFLVFECESRKQARKIETHIKNMKSKKYIENLKKYPEMIFKLKEKYK
ncbi:GIY-YIG nuclease family protein [Flagellimonas sp. 2504JD1-5]